MPQIAKNLTDQLVGLLNSKQYLLLDDGTKFTASSELVVVHNGVDCVRMPPRSLNPNEHLERFMRDQARGTPPNELFR
jgi:hypothetical protein